MIRRAVVVVLVALAACKGSSKSGSGTGSGSSSGSSSGSADTAALDAWVDAELATSTPASVVGVIVGGELVWHRATGSRDGRGGPPPDRTSVFRIGSITKVLTGIAVIQLRDKGVLALDDQVAKYVPELAARLSPAGKPAVTIRHLITHTSGIPTLGDGTASYTGDTPPSEAAFLKALDTPLAFDPGTKADYSNAGMALAGLVVARASKRAYRDYMATEVLAKLAMAPVWDRAAVAADRLVAGRADDGTVDPPTWPLGAFEPAGGLWASLDDMIGLARYATDRGTADRVLPAASRIATMADDPAVPGPFGVAWIVNDTIAGHTGSTTDYSASIVVARHTGVVGVVLVSGSAADLSNCAAVALATAVGTGQAPATCTTHARKPVAAEHVTAALDRLLAFLNAPDDAAAKATFTAEFLAAVPNLLDVTKDINAKLGVCTGFSIGTQSSTGGGEATFACAKTNARLVFQIEGDPPHRLAGAAFPDLR